MPVLFIDMNVRYRIEVPVYRCGKSSCGKRDAPSSFAVGSFPASPDDEDVLLARNSPNPPRWISMALLQMCDSLTAAYPAPDTMSIQEYVTSILILQQSSKCTVELEFAQFCEEMEGFVMPVSAVSFVKMERNYYSKLKCFLHFRILYFAGI